MSSIKYRPDIDGLRALAVLSVLIFHIDASYLSGGFLGVDVFFVISGYLITSIIYKQKIEGNFAYSDFYIKRIKRILPPLFFMLFITLAVGYFVMLPYDFFKMGVSAGSILVFASNMQFALRAGDYFSSNSSEWPLLHTWSLAVEEQYYFIFPIALFLILKYSKKHIILFLTIISACSFILAEYMSRTSGLSSASYYLIVTRMGELLIGSILAIAHQREAISHSKNNFISTSALVFVLALMFFIDKSDPFPGFIALFLCIPVAMLINSKDTVINKLLENKAIVYIGLLSYSLYLFHWPVLAFFRYLYNVTEDSYSLTLTQQAIALVIIIFLTLFSYYVVEKPSRRMQLSYFKTTLFYFVVPSAMVAIVVSVIFFSKGLPARLSSEEIDASKQFSHIDTSKCPSLVRIDCAGGDEMSPKQLTLYGNSHAEHYYSYVSSVAKQHKYKMSLFSSGGCNIQANSNKCKYVKESYFTKLSSTDIAVLAFRWDTVVNNQKELSALEDIIATTKESGTKVVILAQPPVLTSNPGKAFNCNRLDLSCEVTTGFVQSYPEYNVTIEKIALKYKVDFFDPFSITKDRFKLFYDNKMNYFDDDHLSVYGNLWLFKSYEKNSFKSPFDT